MYVLFSNTMSLSIKYLSKIFLSFPSILLFTYDNSSPFFNIITYFLYYEKSTCFILLRKLTFHLWDRRNCLSTIAVREYRKVQSRAACRRHKPAQGCTPLSSTICKQKRPAKCESFQMVELRGVEPLSEKLEAATSTYLADCCYSL